MNCCVLCTLYAHVCAIYCTISSDCVVWLSVGCVRYVLCGKLYVHVHVYTVYCTIYADCGALLLCGTLYAHVCAVYCTSYADCGVWLSVGCVGPTARFKCYPICYMVCIVNRHLLCDVYCPLSTALCLMLTLLHMLFVLGTAKCSICFVSFSVCHVSNCVYRSRAHAINDL